WSTHWCCVALGGREGTGRHALGGGHKGMEGWRIPQRTPHVCASGSLSGCVFASGVSTPHWNWKRNWRSSAFLGSLGPIVSGRGGAAMYIAYKSEFEYASPSPSSSAHLPRRIQNSRTRQGQRGIACKRHARMEGRQDCIYSQGQQGPRSLISEPWLAGHRDAMHAVEKNAERCLRRRAEKDTWPREHRRRASGGKNERMRNPMARPAGEQTHLGIEKITRHW
ncbi:unnamed protein product, partial [Prorocentrum cordatum]